MTSRTIRLDDDVYERLRAHKRPEETYSEAVDRLLGSSSLLDLVGIYSEADVEAIERTLDEKEARDRDRRQQELDRAERSSIRRFCTT